MLAGKASTNRGGALAKPDGKIDAGVARQLQLLCEVWLDKSENNGFQDLRSGDSPLRAVFFFSLAVTQVRNSRSKIVLLAIHSMISQSLTSRTLGKDSTASTFVDAIWIVTSGLHRSSIYKI